MTIGRRSGLRSIDRRPNLRSADEAKPKKKWVSAPEAALQRTAAEVVDARLLSRHLCRDLLTRRVQSLLAPLQLLGVRGNR